MLSKVIAFEELVKIAAVGKNRPRSTPMSTPTDGYESTPTGTPPAHRDGVLEENIAVPSFFLHIAKQVGRKPFCFGLRVHKSLVDQWCSGDKRDPWTAAREAIDVVRAQRRHDLILPILVYIAGGEDFEGAVLSPEEAEALRKIGARIK
jgi:hypothetical protein